GGAPAHHVGGGDVDRAALAEVQGAAVQRADLRAQRLDVREPGGLVHQVGTLDQDERIGRVDHQVPAHPGGHVQHRADIGGVEDLLDLRVVLDLARAERGLRVAHVDVH